MALLDTVKSRLSGLLDEWKETAGKTFTLIGFIDFAKKAVEQAMLIVNPLTDGAQKKALVLDFAGKLFDFFAPYIKSTSWLGWLWRLLGDDTMKQTFLAAVSALVEVIFVEKFKPAV